MILIENLLLREESKFLNYKFDKAQLEFINLRKEDTKHFWSFLSENKNYVLGDLIISDVLVSNTSTKIELKY